MEELLYKDEVYAIIGAAIDVHKELGSGFLEPVYQEALEMEFLDRKIPFQPQKLLLIHYKGRKLNKEYVADFVAFGKIIIELKALDKLSGKEEASVAAQPGLFVCLRVLRG